MSTERDVTRVVRSWLDEGVTVLPDRVLDAVLDQVPATPQRRPRWWARRPDALNAPKILIAVAAVIAVAVVGLNVLPQIGGSVGAAPTQTPTATVTPVPESTGTAIALPSTGPLEAGRYFIAAGTSTPGRLTVTVPAGWATSAGFIYSRIGEPFDRPSPYSPPGHVVFTNWMVTHVYGDACHWAGAYVDAGTTTDQLISALAAQKGRTASAPTDLTISGYPAKRIESRVVADIDLSVCDRGVVSLWPDPGPDASGGLCCVGVGSTDVIYAVDVDGERLVLFASYQLDSSLSEVAELETMALSLKIDPPTASPSAPIVSTAP
jgi:hypothetical protein